MNYAQAGFSHLHPFLEKLWQEVLQGQARSVFFQGSAAEAFSREITRFFARMPGEKVILRRDLDGRPLQAPWFPFLDFVKECTAGREPAALETLFAAADVYSLHRPLVSSWIRGEPLVRDEELLPDELAFEKSRLEEGLLSLLGTLSGEVPLLLLVNNLQLAGSAGLALAARLLDRLPPGRLLFVFLLDRNHRHLAEERAQRWSYFLEEVEEKSTILGSGLPEHPVTLPPPQPETAVGPLVRRCRDAFLLLDHEECRTAGLAAADLGQEAGLQDAPQPVVPVEWSLLLETLGDVHCLLDEPDAALVYLDQLLHYCREHNLLAGLSAACRKTGYVYYLKEDNDTAGDFANQSLKFARQAEDELAVLRACCLLAMIDIRRHNMLLWEKAPELLYPLLRKYRMKNTLSFFYTNSPLYFDKQLEEELTLRKKAIAIAQELGNTCRLAHALQTKGVIYNYMGDETRTLRCYTRSLKLREQLSQAREISQVYNGMGYFHYLNGRYDEACRCFNRALEYLKNLREYIEIILTCYNLALVHFYTGQYARAIDHMEKMFVLIKTLGSTNIPFHSRLGLYSVAALCHLKHGNYLKGIEYLNKKNGAPELFANDQEYHYHELAGALAAWYEGKDADAAAHFDRAGRYLEQNAGISDFRNMFPPFFHEYGVFLKSTGNAAAAAAVWKKGLGYASGSGFGWYRELLEAELAGEPPPRPQFRFEEVRFDFDVIIELARQDKNLVLLHKKISEINFLNNLHVILQREGDSRTLAADFMKLVIGHFLAETGLVCLKQRESWETLHTNDPAAAALPELPALLDLLARDGAARLVTAAREDPELGALTGAFNSVIALPLLRSRQVTGMVVFATRQQELVLYENDLRILAIAAAQFSDTLERLELHRTLEEKTRALESANRELNAEKVRRDKEYERAKIVQQTIFTSQEEYRHIGGVDIDVLFLPRNDRVSGDYYNILSDGEGQAAFLIADASGHGIQAALSTMQLDLLFKQGLAVSDIARRMEYLNKMLADELHSQNFCTAFAMRLEQHRIRYTSAGHPAQYLVKAGGGTVVALKTPGIPLGIYGDRRYVNGEQSVGPGDILVLFTDGLFEECNARGEIWGEERLLESIVKYAASPDMSMADFNAWLVHDLRSFLGRKSFEDDLTLISARIR